MKSLMCRPSSWRISLPVGWAHVFLTGEYLWPNGEKLRVSFRPQPEPTPMQAQATAHWQEYAATGKKASLMIDPPRSSGLSSGS
ncbi:Uncharacterized protein ALO50_04044 [Pseudomonas syringae pv. cerasicola]|uniref:Uncharacterized protein n=2 Tax=Pseudomonas syringae group TaxID=136849 RepID=A0A0P9P9G3_PSESX|nr:hypothetical protein [Pseudomonas syringae]KPW95233.1 Uncharacterized protein ALO50_04044 [Pseudomonas syringae pv. cerasicola]RMT48951.1 hypothetical protein ALP47_01636 [Pseudomonas savastanoi]